MVAFSVRRVKDLNEITSHMLEVVQAHLLSDRSSCTVVSVNCCSVAVYIFTVTVLV